MACWEPSFVAKDEESVLPVLRDLPNLMVKRGEEEEEEEEEEAVYKEMGVW